MTATDINSTVARIDASLSPSAEINVRALAVSLALQLIAATKNNVEATFKFQEVSKLVITIINDRAPSA